MAKELIERRVLDEADYIIETGDTVRGTAKEFGVSKSTVHKDMTVILKDLDYSKYLKVLEKININLNDRHIRGGLSTKKRFEQLREIGG